MGKDGSNFRGPFADIHRERGGGYRTLGTGREEEFQRDWRVVTVSTGLDSEIRNKRKNIRGNEGIVNDTGPSVREVG